MIIYLIFMSPPCGLEYIMWIEEDQKKEWTRERETERQEETAAIVDIRSPFIPLSVCSPLYCRILNIELLTSNVLPVS